jgi:hypothetical protein
MTLPEIEAAKFRLVAQCLNKLRHRVTYIEKIGYIIFYPNYNLNISCFAGTGKKLCLV